MKAINIFSTLVATITLQANATAQTTVTNTTSGNCSPIITGSNNKVEIRCENPTINDAIRDLVKKSLKGTNDTMMQISSAQQSTSRLVKNLQYRSERQHSEIADIANQIYALKYAIERQRPENTPEIDALKKGLENISAQYSLGTEFASNLVEGLREKIDEKMLSISNRVQSSEQELIIHDLRIKALESDVATLMELRSKGLLESGIMLFGAHMGQGNIYKANASEVGLDYEFLFTGGSIEPFIYSISASLGRINSGYQSTSPTYAGAPPISNEINYSTNFASIGPKLSGKSLSGRFYPYIKLLALVYSPSSKNSRMNNGVGISAGIDWARSTSKISIELTTRSMQIYKESITFNPNGDSIVNSGNRRVWTPLLSVSISFT
jgi:hypothetical protein